jgi:dynein heavy chain
MVASQWLPGLFNAMAFLTAIMQVTARQTGLPLDNMAIETHITTMMQPEEVRHIRFISNSLALFV